MLLQHLLLWLIIFNSTVEVHASSEAVQEFWDSFAPLILPQSAHVGYAAFMHSFSLLYVDAHTILSGIIVSSKVPYRLKHQSVHEDLQLLAHGLVHVHNSIKLWQLWTSHIPYFRQFPWLKNVDGCFSSSPQIGKSYQHLYCGCCTFGTFAVFLEREWRLQNHSQHLLLSQHGLSCGWFLCSQLCPRCR